MANSVDPGEAAHHVVGGGRGGFCTKTNSIEEVGQVDLIIQCRSRLACS